MATLGQKNNNPLNIRTNPKNHWLGLIGDCCGFCVFGGMDFGFRAAMILLSRYILYYDCKSVRQIVYRFAPPSENATHVYLGYCEKRLSDNGFKTFPLSPYTDSFFCLLSAMAYYESNVVVDIDTLRKIAKKFNLF